MRPYPSPRRAARRPQLELLEDRTLLSAGALDPAFGTGGLVVSPRPTGGAEARAVLMLPGGKILAAGVSDRNAGGDNFALARYHADGSLDTSFGTNGVVATDFNGRDSVAALARQPDGKIVAVGRSVLSRPFRWEARLALARYLPNGALDASFGRRGTVLTTLSNNGYAANDGLSAVALQADGKIVVAGGTARFAGGDNFLVARYTAAGSLDLTFGGSGFVVTDFGGADWANSLAIQGDGKLVAAGQAGHFALARYNVTGALDATFGSGGKVVTVIDTTSRAADVALLGDGRIVVGGTHEEGGFAVARYAPNGGLDPTFGAGGVVTTAPTPIGMVWASGMALQPDGKIVVVGPQPFNPGDYDFALLRLNGADGSVDTTFGTGGWVETDFAPAFGATVSHDSPNAVALQTDGKIVVAGTSGVLGTSNFALARYEGDSPLGPEPPPGSGTPSADLIAALTAVEDTPEAAARSGLANFWGRRRK